jgi:hypothetical protein
LYECHRRADTRTMATISWMKLWKSYAKLGLSGHDEPALRALARRTERVLVAHGVSGAKHGDMR